MEQSSRWPAQQFFSQIFNFQANFNSLRRALRYDRKMRAKLTLFPIHSNFFHPMPNGSAYCAVRVVVVMLARVTLSTIFLQSCDKV